MTSSCDTLPDFLDGCHQSQTEVSYCSEYHCRGRNVCIILCHNKYYVCSGIRSDRMAPKLLTRKQLRMHIIILCSYKLHKPVERQDRAKADHHKRTNNGDIKETMSYYYMPLLYDNEDFATSLFVTQFPCNCEVCFHCALQLQAACYVHMVDWYATAG